MKPQILMGTDVYDLLIIWCRQVQRVYLSRNKNKSDSQNNSHQYQRYEQS